jgi:hypothetical protein
VDVAVAVDGSWTVRWALALGATCFHCKPLVFLHCAATTFPTLDRREYASNIADVIERILSDVGKEGRKSTGKKSEG